jgi:predicted PurR-regulated permease PerM
VDQAAGGVASLQPLVLSGVATLLVGGIPAAAALAGSAVLGVLIMYYLLKDAEKICGWVVSRMPPAFREEGAEFLEESAATLRVYARGRTVLAAMVAGIVGLAALVLGVPLVGTLVLVNFVGGYIPYLGAFLGGGLAVLLALADGGFVPAVTMLVVVLAANLGLENLVEPHVMGRSLDLHPLAVLILTTLGGVLGGIVGLVLAVPIALIAGRAVSRLMRLDVLGPMTTRVSLLRREQDAPPA